MVLNMYWCFCVFVFHFLFCFAVVEWQFPPLTITYFTIVVFALICSMDSISFFIIFVCFVLISNSLDYVKSLDYVMVS